jgi:3-dehydroquinate dehydratase type II
MGDVSAETDGMRHVVVINGPNLNLLGTREPEIYGTTTLADLEDLCKRWGADLGVEVATFQSNHEGAIIDRIHQAARESDALVLNAGALSHTSYAIQDAIVATGLPAVEVHISNIHAREAWRRTSVTAPACVLTIYGRGTDGYRWALQQLVARTRIPPTELAYGSNSEQLGDLRLPDEDAPHPVAVLVHGGFWREHWTRDVMDAVAVDLTTRGWATWNLEFRRVGGGGGWPTTLMDVAAGIDHLADLARSHQLDLDRLVVIGHSAGGHLALWSGGRKRLASGAPGADPEVTPAAVIALAGVSDLGRAADLGIGDEAVTDFLRRTPSEDEGRYAVADPMRLLPLGTPVLLIHGDADEPVPVDLSRAFAGAAADAGDTVVYHELEGVDHRSLIDPTSTAWVRVVEELAALSVSP